MPWPPEPEPVPLSALDEVPSVSMFDDDAELPDLNGESRAGVLTKYTLQRTCLINLLLLMAGAMMTAVTKNLKFNGYFTLVTGNVLRREILEVEKLSCDPDGHNDTIVDNSLKRRLSTHRLSVSANTEVNDRAVQ